MPETSAQVPGVLIADLDAHVGAGGTIVRRGEAIRASIRGTPDVADGIDTLDGRLADGREASDA